MKTVVIRFYEKGEVPRRATITYSGEVPKDQIKKILKWGLNKEEFIHKAKSVLTINVVPSS